MAHTDRRAQILDAIEKLMASRRLAEITTDDVAAEAHVGKGTIYRYFQDKDEMFFEAATRGFEQLCDLLERTVHHQAPFRDQLIEAARQISGFHRRRKQLFRMMNTEDGRTLWCKGELRQRWQARRQTVVTRMAAIMARGVQEGALRSELTPEVLAHLMLGMLRTRGRDMAEVPESDRPIELIVELFLHGAAAPVPAAAAAADAHPTVSLAPQGR